MALGADGVASRAAEQEQPSRAAGEQASSGADAERLRREGDADSDWRRSSGDLRAHT